jgi:hemoglobin
MTTTATLYERLGGGEKLRAMICDLTEAHLQNPLIGMRFAPFEREALQERAFLFFAAATGGQEVYSGRGLREVHRNMNVNEHELVAAIDDVLAVLERHGVGEREQQEVLAALWAMKGDVLHL